MNGRAPQRQIELPLFPSTPFPFTMSTPRENDPQSQPSLTTEEEVIIQENARWLRRAVNPFTDFYIIACIGAAGSPSSTETARQREDNRARDHAKGLTEVQKQIHIEDFNEIAERLPFLKGYLDSDKPTRFIKKIITKAQTRASGARQSDTKGLKQAIIEFIPVKYAPRDDNGNPPPSFLHTLKVKSPGATKAWRGWENITIARLLCPIDHLAEFIGNPEGTRAKLSDNRLTLCDSAKEPKFPSFLYDEESNNGSLSQGLFRGPVLLAVYKHIFIAPSAATGAKASLKRGNAKIHGLEKVTPPTICYAAIQAYIGLCSAVEWKEEWKGVNLQRLYLLLREQLAYPDDPWHIETLKWWDEQVFGSSPGDSERPQEPAYDEQGPSSRERAEVERRQRMQAAA